MPPFVRIRLMKCELENQILSNSNKLDYFVAVNIKECVMENGNLLGLQLCQLLLLHNFFAGISCIYHFLTVYAPLF